MEINLLLHDPAPSETEPVTRFGGRPLVPAGEPFSWPVCSICEGNMQFMGQLRVPSDDGDRLLILFQCQNEPGMCEDWEADGRGNRAMYFNADGELRLADFPPKGEVSRNTMYGARIEQHEAGNYDEAQAAWVEDHQNRGREVLGQLFGQPTWIQADETPECNDCGGVMRFVAQLEEGPDYRTAMNFGGGAAYVFDCSCGSGAAKLLWQQ